MDSGGSSSNADEATAAALEADRTPADQVWRTYTRAEVSAQASAEKVLVILFNSVYDLTGFVERHPGGGSVLLAYVGRDATGGFEAIGHSTSAHQWAKEFKVGEIVATERI